MMILVIKKPYILNQILLSFSIGLSASVFKMEERVEEYLLYPVMPNKSLKTFLAKLFFVIGNGELRLRSGSSSVSVKR